MQDILRYGVILSFLVCLVSLTVEVLKTISFGRRTFHAEPAGKGSRGIWYAFTRGMMPWEKESARKHLAVYSAGILYHLGIFSALFYLLTLIIPFRISLYLSYFVCGAISIGLACGLGLLARRIFLPYVRKISCMDDYGANILVNLFLILVLADIFLREPRSILFLVTMVLFLYIPVGKIRHCFFFFYSRALFGLFFGRRNILPQRRVV